MSNASIVQQHATLWQAYTQEIVAWQGISPAKSCAPTVNLMPQEDVLRHVQRTLSNGKRQQADIYILLGCHAHVYDVFLAQVQMSDPSAHICILESQPERARNFLSQYAPLPNQVHVLVDTSPWALCMLTKGLGLDASSCALFFTEPPKARCAVLEKWRKLFLGAQQEHVPASQAVLPKLTVGAIMHPDELYLEEFFAQIPSWVHEVVVVWDTATGAAHPEHACAVPVRHYTRPLAADFATQRNALLAQCHGDWLLYLDADERFSADTWHDLPSHMQESFSGGVLFPRHTFEGDEAHVRTGYGLWPDVQLRLFPLGGEVHFVGTVHERVQGLKGAPVLALAQPLLHYSHVHKNAAQLQARLDVFSAAGQVQHTLSDAYPRLPNSFFSQIQKSLGRDTVLRLPV